MRTFDHLIIWILIKSFWIISPLRKFILKMTLWLFSNPLVYSYPQWEFVSELKHEVVDCTSFSCGFWCLESWLLSYLLIWYKKICCDTQKVQFLSLTSTAYCASSWPLSTFTTSPRLRKQDILSAGSEHRGNGIKYFSSNKRKVITEASFYYSSE